MNARRLWPCALLLLPNVLGCIIEAPGGQPKGDRPRTVSASPLAVKSGAKLEDKVEIVGATVTPGQLIPGQGVDVSVQFRVLEDLTEDYGVFVHIEDVDSRMERINADHRPAGGRRPSSEWKKGELIRDDFQLFLPPGASPRALNIFIGLWQQARDARLKLSNPEAVRHDGNDRILLVQIPVLG
jgi:hypothetical protein